MSDPLDGDDVNWFDEHWMFIGLAIGGAVVLHLASRPAPESRHSALLALAWAMVPVYSLHQFEEHGWDCLGRRYAFIDFFNDMVGEPILTPRMITIINVAIVWVAFPSCALYAECTADLTPASLCWGLCLCNGAFAHCLPALVTLAYNPGAVQSATLLVPGGLIWLKYICRVSAEAEARLLIVASLVYGGPVAHGLGLFLPARLLHAGVLSHAGLTVWILVVTLAIPLAVGLCLARVRSRWVSSAGYSTLGGGTKEAVH